jgi:hypothetical protein
MPSSQGSQVQTLVIELSENIYFSNGAILKEKISLHFLIGIFAASHIPLEFKTLLGGL